MANITYEVSSNYGSGTFHNEHDAILALQMLADYHGKAINRTDVQWALEKTGSYEYFPLCITKCTE